MMFTDEEKQTAFDRIAALYYDRNFGTVSKGDFETLLFDIYIEHLLSNGEPYDDYTMSKTLGISQSRIRSLKVKKELKYPHKSFDWKDVFTNSIKTAVYDEDKHSIYMHISDVNVMTELRHFVESNGWFDSYQLNPHVFSCRLDFFLKICETMSGERLVVDAETKEMLKELQKSEATSSIAGKFLTEGISEGYKALALSASKEVALAVLHALPFGGIAAKAVGFLIEVIKNS